VTSAPQQADSEETPEPEGDMPESVRAPIASEEPEAAAKRGDSSNEASDAGSAGAPTLVEYFSARSVAPKQFLRRLKAANRWTFEPDDVDEAVRIALESDPDLRRCRSLLHVATLANDRQHERGLSAFIDRVLERHLSAAWQPARDDPTEVLSIAIEALRPELKGKPSRRTLNVLLLCVERMGGRPGLQLDAVVDALGGAVGDPAPHARKPSDHTRARVAAITDPGLGASELRAWLALSSDLRRWARRAQQDAETARAELAATADDLASAQQRLADLRTEVDGKAAQLAQARQEIGTLAARVEESRMVGRHGRSQVQARVEDALRTRVVPLLTTADEALGVEPPRVAVAREKLGFAIEAIDDEISWLASSD